MPDFRHQVTTPEELIAPHRMDGAGISFRMQLLSSWLIENTGEATTTLWQNNDCSSEIAWKSEPPSFGRNQPGAIAIENSQFDLLLQTSSNSNHTPEPTTLVTHSERFIWLVGFDVWGMGQLQRVGFYRGDSMHPLAVPVPNGYWFLKNSHLL